MKTYLRIPSFTLGVACLLSALSACSRQGGAVQQPAPAPVVVVPKDPAPGKEVKAVVRAASDDEPKGGPAKEAAKVDGPSTSPFANDRGTKLVAGLLRPSEEVFAEEARKGRGRRQFAGPSFLEQPSLPLPPAVGEVRQPGLLPAGKPLRPGPLPEDLPLSRYRDEPTPPRREQLPTPGVVRLPSLDLNEPVPLPLLAGPQPDRAPVTDPTAEFSTASVLAAAVPLRGTPAPFVRLNLPDPFEHVQTARLRTPPDEDPVPPIATPRTPTK